MNRLAWVMVLAFFLLIPMGHGYAGEDVLEIGDHDFEHAKWHAPFYQELNRKAQINCCGANDCRPTVRKGNLVLVDGEWCPISLSTKWVYDLFPPDGKVHICAPKDEEEGVCPFIICIVSPLGA